MNTTEIWWISSNAGEIVHKRSKFLMSIDDDFIGVARFTAVISSDIGNYK